jgi:hypothetical protein
MEGNRLGLWLAAVSGHVCGVLVFALSGNIFKTLYSKRKEQLMAGVNKAIIIG